MPIHLRAPWTIQAHVNVHPGCQGAGARPDFPAGTITPRSDQCEREAGDLSPHVGSVRHIPRDDANGATSM